MADNNAINSEPPGARNLVLLNMTGGGPVMASVGRSITMSIRDRAGKATVPLAVMTLIVSLCLWGLTSGIYYRPLPKPACALRLPFVLLQACADDDGVHFLAMKQDARQFPAIKIGRATYMGNAGYHHGGIVNILGLVMAVLPTTYNGGDYFVSPHVALCHWALQRRPLRGASKDTSRFVAGGVARSGTLSGRFLN